MLRHPFSTYAYAGTVKNLTLTASTRVIYQNFTGATASANAAASLAYGTNVVGGVTPNRSGVHLDLPLFSTVAKAARALNPDASAIFAPAPHAAAAIIAAIAAEIPLVVAVAEHVPAHDMLRVHEVLRTQSRTRLLGPNCAGVIRPAARCRIGLMPPPVFAPGVVGIVARSGTLGYEAAASTTSAGLGQSCVLGVGGDWIPGTSLAEGVRFLLDDAETRGVVVIGEVGGEGEMDVAQVVEYWKGERKPVLALLAGWSALDGTAMGHAGAVRAPGDPTLAEKRDALVCAGVTMVRHPGEFGPRMAAALGGQRRSVHTARPPPPPPSPSPPKTTKTTGPHQLLWQHLELLQNDPLWGARAALFRGAPSPECMKRIPATITFDRRECAPCILITLDAPERIEFPYATGPAAALEAAGCHWELVETLTAAWGVWKSTGAYTLHLPSITTMSHTVVVLGGELTPDPALAQDGAGGGVLHIPLPGHGRIGVVANGAGLAMNTCDVLAAYASSSSKTTAATGPATGPANFLDTGGKATPETVREAFDKVMADGRVRGVLVNVFAGVLDCRVIARGVVEACKDLGGVPVVVRLRGSWEEEGREIVSLFLSRWRKGVLIRCGG
ncbi:putative succinyl-CoA synthetase subunit alpha [Geopyxis carbonaria]|nr:putative succinyl-CoA synthetase subunit alpha [Geopyxis carbonaria]